MILDLNAVCSNADTEEDREVHIDMDTFSSKMGVFPIIKKEPFKLHLASVDSRRLMIQGELDITVSISCDRCLTEVPTKLHLSIDKDLPLPEPAADGVKKPGEKESVSEDDDNLEQLEYMDGCQLDVDRLVYGEILLVWPMKVLCKDDCRGICIKCGANRNEVDCGCDQTIPDPRMAAFQDVFNKFKEV